MTATKKPLKTARRSARGGLVWEPGDLFLTRDSKVGRVLRLTREDGVEFAWFRYLDPADQPEGKGYVMEGPDGNHVWEHCVHDRRAMAQPTKDHPRTPENDAGWGYVWVDEQGMRALDEDHPALGGSGRPAIAENLRRGDVIRNPHKRNSRVRVKAVKVDRRANTVLIDFIELRKDGSGTEREGNTTMRTWDRAPVLPSAGGSINPPSDNHTTTGEARSEEEGSQMATVTRKKAAKKATAKTTTKATSEAKPSRAKFAPTKAEVEGIAKSLRDGTKMNEIKAQFGLSNGQPVRKALLEHGFDSKGNKNPEGLSARELQARRAAEAAKAKPAAKKSGGKKAGKKGASAPDPSSQA